MNIEDLTLGQIKQLSGLLANRDEGPFEAGTKVFIRTVTHYLTGQVVAYCGDFVQLESAAWIADTGRFMQFLVNGELNEVEPINGPWWVNLQSVIDMGHWNHKLPGEQK